MAASSSRHSIKLLTKCVQHSIKRRYLSTTIKQEKNKNLNNGQAIHLLKGIIKQANDKSFDLKQEQMVIHSVFRIYDRINETKNGALINHICRIFLQYNGCNKFDLVWNDIENIQDKTCLHFDLLLKCAIKCDKIDIKHYVEILKWMQENNYILSIRPRFLTQLINKCDKNSLKYLKYIHSVLLSDSIKLDINIKDNIYIQTNLINQYSICNDLESALNVFDSIPEIKRDIICIGAMMKAFLNNNDFEQVLKLFDDVNRSNIIKHDLVTNLLSIKACTESKNFIKGREIIKQINENTNENNNISMINTLINFYGNANDLDNAIKLFESIDDKEKNIMTIGAMMDAYCKCNKDKECLELYYKIYSMYDLKPDISTFIIALISCTNGTIYHSGKDIHKQLKQNKDYEWMLENIDIQINLINMYGKCSMLNECQLIFDRIKLTEIEKYYGEISIWNAMIHAFGRNGIIDKVMQFYYTMKDEINIKMNDKTYILILNALSYVGDISLAQNIWNDHIQDHEIKYNRFVITSLIDCFSRKGMLQNAYQIIKQYEKINNKYDEIMWITLLSNCNKYKQFVISNDDIYKEYNQRFKG